MSLGVDISTADRVLSIRFNRPDKKNAITTAMYAAMVDALENIDPSVRAVLFSGEGGGFSSGNDLKDFLAGPPSSADHPTIRFIKALPKVAVPMVASVQGVAVGIGTTLLLHCDLVVAASDAQFALSFVKLGLVPEAASSLLLSRLMGHQLAAKLLLLGDPFDAATAEKLGIVTHLTTPEALAETTRKLVGKLLALPPGALKATKALMKGDSQDVTAHMDSELKLFSRSLNSPEFKEAAAAFLEKRAPDFSQFS